MNLDCLSSSIACSVPVFTMITLQFHLYIDIKLSISILETTGSHIVHAATEVEDEQTIE